MLETPWFRYRRPVMYLVRHGSTPMNSEEVYRGWADPELSEKGHAEGEALSNFFSYETLGPVVAADFRRTMQTAQYVVPYSAASHFVDPNANLRTLNIGKFSGQPKNAENEKELQRYIRNPDLMIPGGEALNGFLARWEETFHSYLVYASEELPTVLVVEGCNIGATAYISLDDSERPDYFDPYENTIVAPGGVIGVYLDDAGKMSIEPRFGEAEKMELQVE